MKIDESIPFTSENMSFALYGMMVMADKCANLELKLQESKEELQRERTDVDIYKEQLAKAEEQIEQLKGEVWNANAETQKQIDKNKDQSLPQVGLTNFERHIILRDKNGKFKKRLKTKK